MDEQQLKAGALLLWALMGTPEGELDKFRRQRLGRSSQLDLAHLERVRELLVALVQAVRDDREQGWEKVEGAWELLRQIPMLDEAAAQGAATAEDTAAEDTAAEDTASDTDAPKTEPDADPQAPPRFVPPRPQPLMPSAAKPIASPWMRSKPPASTTLEAAGTPPAGAAPEATAKPEGGAQPEGSAQPDVDRTADLPQIDPLDQTTDVDHISELVLPFRDADADKPRRDPHDPEAATIKLRAHVLPFRKGRTAEAAAKPGDKPAASTRSASKGTPKKGAAKKGAGSNHTANAEGPAAPSSQSAQTLPAMTRPSRRGTASGRAKRPADSERTELVELPMPPAQSKGVEEGSGSAFEAVERYAALCAECSVSPERLEEIRAVYGIDDEEAHEDLDLLWNERFGDDTSLLKVWDERFQALRGELLAARKG